MKKISSSTKHLIAIVVVIIAGMFIINALANAAPAQQYPPGYSYTCPAGSYPIGDGVCKAEPTGCPFGDSVPMDKCEPPSDIECNADWSECHPRTNKKQGSPKPSTNKPVSGGSQCSSK